MDPRVIEITDLESLGRHGEAWDRLAETTPPFFPSCSHAFVSAFLERALPEGTAWRVYLAFDGERLVGVLPLVVSSRPGFGRVARVLETPSNEDTFGVAPLLEAGREAVMLDLLLAKAWSANHGVRHIEFRDVSSRLDLEAFAGGQLSLEVSKRTGRFIPTTGSQEDYQASLSKNFKKNQRKAFNKLKRLPDVEDAFLEADGDGVAQLEEFMRVEALSWKGKEGTAVICSETMTSYYRKLVENLSGRGWLEWQVLRTEGQTIAMNLTIRFHRSLVLLKLGYDGEYSKCSPGGMLLQKQVDRCFADDAIDEIDIITDAGWYDDWRMERREYRLVRFYPQGRVRALLFCYLPDRFKVALRRNRLVAALLHRLRG